MLEQSSEPEFIRELNRQVEIAEKLLAAHVSSQSKNFPVKRAIEIANEIFENRWVEIGTAKPLKRFIFQEQFPHSFVDAERFLKYAKETQYAVKSVNLAIGIAAQNPPRDTPDKPLRKI